MLAVDDAAGGSAFTLDEDEIGGGVNVLLLETIFRGVRALPVPDFGIVLAGDVTLEPDLLWKNASLDSNHSFGCSPTYKIIKVDTKALCVRVTPNVPEMRRQHGHTLLESACG